MKYLWLLLLAAVAWRLVAGRWPWEMLRRREPGRSPARSEDAESARLLLGVPQGAQRQQIIEAHRRLVATVHPDRGGMHELVIEANAARDTLLSELEHSRQETA
ncbi:MAG: J domain-containing protein [Novosphingobium sp.]|nr:J domain-containing protein [Novosphingobium sp.]